MNYYHRQKEKEQFNIRKIYTSIIIVIVLVVAIIALITLLIALNQKNKNNVVEQYQAISTSSYIY